MQRTVALRERGRFAALLNSILRAARRRATWSEPDARNLRTWRQLVLGVLVHRSTRLLRLAQAVLPERQASRVKTAALGLGYFLARADFPIGGFSRRLLLALARALPAERLVSYRGKVLLVGHAGNEYWSGVESGILGVDGGRRWPPASRNRCGR